MNIVEGTDRGQSGNVSMDSQIYFKMKKEKMKMRKSVVLVGLLLLTAGLALAQDFPKVETSMAFMYIRTPVSFAIPGGPSASASFNCAGAGGTLAYNVTSVVGLAADLGGCKYFGQTLPAPISNNIDGSAFTFLFGPRFTARSHSAFRPFADVNFGGVRLKFTCDSSSCPNSPSISKTAFGMTAGGGFDVKITPRFGLRLIQAEYLYTRFGNNCSEQICSNNNNQNSFRLKSGIVIGW